ncbi:hypothetical protein [Mucilaginibacter sp. KACC 22063]|uniref:hypothetical protein n=1 Tax=Mucilaginibacter sp. KACC 22063 TaxID=3025666 RepID=UPI002365C837|nr:hypothetical protein [Mucilaginibacter sp. KACC 22063]WDF53409.1 hypothetical protein PQ461_10670 [Mucilaginibacter sp. KACC 22063]
MARFIELLDKNNRNTLINVDNILSTVIYEVQKEDTKETEEEVRVYMIGDSESYLTVKETFAEFKEKLLSVAEITDLR